MDYLKLAAKLIGLFFSAVIVGRLSYIVLCMITGNEFWALILAVVEVFIVTSCLLAKLEGDL